MGSLPAVSWMVLGMYRHCRPLLVHAPAIRAAEFFVELLTGPETLNNVPSDSPLHQLTRQGLNDVGKSNAIFHDRAEHVHIILLWTPAA